MTAGEPEPQTARSSLAEAAVAVGVAAALLAAGAVALFFVSGALPPGYLLPWTAGVLGWRTPAWAVATAAIALRAAPSARRARLSVIAAAVIAGVEGLVGFFLATGLSFHPVALIGLIPALLSVAAFVLCAVLGWGLARRLLARAPVPRGAVVGGLLVAGGILVLVLVQQWFGLYFRIWGWDPLPEYEDFGPEGIRYLVTAALTLAALVAALVVAIRSRRRGLAVAAGILLGLALLVAIVLQVPQGRFIPAPPVPEPVDPHYVECSYDASRPGCGG